MGTGEEASDLPAFRVGGPLVSCPSSPPSAVWFLTANTNSVFCLTDADDVVGVDLFVALGVVVAAGFNVLDAGFYVLDGAGGRRDEGGWRLSFGVG